MLQTLINKLKKSPTSYLAVGAVIIFILIVVSFIGNTSDNVNGNDVFVPEEFTESRNNAGEIAEEITDLTRISSRSISTISSADRAGDYAYGLQLVREEIDRNAEIRDAAAELSEELRIMSINLTEVRPDEASDIGYQAVTSGIELVQHLVNYNNYTYDLLNLIEARLEGVGTEDTEERINKLVLDINTEAELVNALNEDYKSLSRKFNGITTLEEE